ncbi:hypothetical protein E8E15_006639 [Penicillium rubens]|uniref:Uncharacterized protein n=1 Tax=Penicillium chrysogenum TaxID=5076 RepID=A0A161Z2S5_PENCH|nr:uncharacterized protein N7525_011378 [Penicillium rubens]KAF3015796.1 hypothetical protein E8E15_006639 [Penicillium rubens]KAJ5822094.1 hypothetical protein N7525_011378 [Penicillium rubens]KAJ5859734.1 hypothetical protein N7534_005011 [Penicillium rubens]KZN83596.1 hypothetical protein EN45_106990 [Penicillium chrysogenum]
MSRAFSTARQNLARWLGYNKELLPESWRAAVERYEKGGAVKKVGEIESIEILHRNDGSSPIHKSHFNRADKADILSVRVKPFGGLARTHHIYIDGTGTLRKGDIREYSTTSTRTT